MIPLLTPQRDTGKIKDIQNIRCTQLILNTKTKDVKIPYGPIGLQGKKGHVFFPKQGFQIRTGSHDSFHGKVRTAIDHLIKDTQTKMTHPDLIEIGKSHHHLHRSTGKILIGNIPLLANIATGTFYPVEEPFHGYTLILFHYCNLIY